MWSSFVAIFRKEFIHVTRDRGTLIVALSIPLFQLVLFGFIDQNVRDLPTIVVDQDNSQYSRELMDQLRATRTFDIVEMTNDPHRARTAVVSGSARVAVLIPPDYHEARALGRPAHVQILIDGSDSTASSQALASANGLALQTSWNEAVRRVGGKLEPALSVQPIILFNPNGRTANFIIPGLVAVLLQMVATVLAAMALVRERERGTLEQLLVTPLDPVGLMLGKLGPYLVLGLFEMATVLIAMRWGFQVPIRGSVIFLFGVAVIYLFALLSMGLFISTRASSQAEAMQLSMMLILPSVFLSGYIFPASGLPLPLYWLGRLLPATHMIAIMRGVVLRDAGPIQLLPYELALVAESVVLVWLSVRSFRKVAF